MLSRNSFVIARRVASTATLRSATTTSTTMPARFLHIEKRIEELGLVLPPPAPPRANYNSVCQGPGSNMLFMSGHLPFEQDGKTLMTGRIGGSGGRDVDYGYQAARQIGLNLLATLKDQLGDLDRVEKVVKIFGIVQSADNFHEQHLVMNGCSDLMMEVFGKEIGFHARSAIGTNALPLGVSVEIEAIIQVKPE